MLGLLTSLALLFEFLHELLHHHLGKVHFGVETAYKDCVDT